MKGPVLNFAMVAIVFAGFEPTCAMAAPPPEAAPTDLQTPAGEAWGINNRSQIVGTHRGTPYAIPFLWQSGNTIDLDVLPSSRYSTLANDVNDLGQIVGRTLDVQFHAHAVAWQDGSIAALEELPGANASAAVAINNRGQIVGASGSLPFLHAVEWRNGMVSRLEELPGWRASFAYGVNENGWVVGVSTDATGLRHAVLWQNGIVTELGTLPGGSHSAASDINNCGQIVGSSDDASGFDHAVIWQNGSIAPLGDPPGSLYSFATAINDRGQVVGTSVKPSAWSFDLDHAALWQDGSIVELGELPFGNLTSSRAIDINDRGQIVGSSGGYEASTVHPVLWEVR